ncbi:MAG: MFS transporter [Planctomyces sp.]|nr:MFS transporter [Planctomycetaceae bacterium]MBQ10496.1 MFS transporter [Planctomyces sp.]
MDLTNKASFPEETGHVEERPTRVRWFVLAIVAFAASSAYLTRHCISAANTTIAKDLDLTDTQMGLVMSAFSLGYMLFQVPSGWLGNRLGTRFAFAFTSIVWSLCNVWSSVSVGLGMLTASRFGLGVFQAGLAPLSAKILKDWIPLRNFGMSSAAIGASMSVGGAFTMWLTGWLLDPVGNNLDWRVIFFAYSSVGIIWALGFAWFFRTRPEDHRWVNQAELKKIRDVSEKASTSAGVSDSDQSRVFSAGTLLRSPSMWGLCLQSFFRSAGYLFFVTWFFAFLEYVYGVDKASAGLYNSFPLIAVVTGSLTGGMIVDGLFRVTGSKLISRSGTAFVALTVCGTLTMVSAWTSEAWQLSAVIAVGALFSGIGNPAAWAATLDLGGRHVAVVMGVMNMTGCLAGVLLPVLLGNWFEEIKQTGGDWDSVIYLHAGFYFCGALCWLVIKPNRSLDD